MDLQIFHFFPKLPTELRIKVWYHTLPGPRELRPKWPSPKISPSVEVLGLRRRDTRNGPQIPDLIALRINRESRDLALTYYERRSGLVEPGEGYYIDYKIDSLYFNIIYDSRQAFPRLVNRTYHDNGVLRSFDVTWILHEWNHGDCGPWIEGTDEMKRARAVTISGDWNAKWVRLNISTIERWMRDWHEFSPNLEVIYLKFPSVHWSRPIIEPGRLRLYNRTKDLGRMMIALGERYIKNLAREKELRGLEWKPPRVEAMWPEDVGRGPKYIYPSQYK